MSKKDQIINIIELILKEIPENIYFDSHLVIELIIQKDSDLYLQYSSEFKPNENFTALYHSNLSQLISKFEGKSVRKIGDSRSFNIHHKLSNCMLWQKI